MSLIKKKKKLRGTLICTFKKDYYAQPGAKATEEQKKKLREKPLFAKGRQCRLHGDKALELKEAGYVDLIDPINKNTITEETIEDAKNEK